MKNFCLLWDFDQTLAYRDGMWTQSVCDILERAGYLSYDREAISLSMRPHYPWAKYELSHSEYFNGLDWWGYINTVVGRSFYAAGISDKVETERLVSQFRQEYLRADAWYLYEDTERNLAKSLERGYDNIILSNHTPELSMLAGRLQIAKYFTHIISSAQVGYEKPNPNFYKVIKTFAQYDKYFMIGDNYNADIIGAKQAGYEAILVRSENRKGYPLYSENLDGIWKYIL